MVYDNNNIKMKQLDRCKYISKCQDISQFDWENISRNRNLTVEFIMVYSDMSSRNPCIT